MSDPQPTDDAAPETPAPGLLAKLRSPVVFAAVVTSLIGFLAFAALRSGRQEAPPEVRLARALERLDQRKPAANRTARSIAKKLLAEEYRDPDFGGALEFILGTVAQRSATEAGELAGDDKFVEAIRLLREAERRTLVDDRVAEWSRSMGIALARIGSTREAEPYLRRATEALDAGSDLGRMEPFVEALLATGKQDLVERGLTLNEALLVENEMDKDTDARDELILQRAQLLLALGRTTAAEAEFARLSESGRASDAATLFRGRALVEEQRFEEAVGVLSPIAERSSDGYTTREATFLTGRASESLGDADNAIRFYQQVADRHPESHEGVAARLRAAELLRLAGRREESLDAYERVMQATPRAGEYRNRWLPLDEFRRTALGAWNALLDSGAYADAIELASKLEPLFPGAGAPELVARATKRWAEDDQARLDAAPWSARPAARPLVIERWHAAGEAYEALADELRTTTEFGPALYDAARNFSRGHEFEKSLALLDQFIETRPRELLPDALLHRGRTLFDLGRLDDARAQFMDVADRFPTSPTSYEARFEIGRCHYEKDDRNLAEKAWAAVLGSPELGPSADVWKKALLATAKLNYHWARADHRASLRPGVDEPAAAEGRQRAYTRWDDAITRLSEYLRRYGGGQQTAEARYLLARALLDRADEPRRELRVAETENTRVELRRKIESLLRQSIDEYRDLQEMLAPLESDDQLAPADRELLKSSYLDIAQGFYDLHEYDEAIVSYAAAANRYPEDARVLVCYLQMSNAYNLLGKPVEARSMLQQARLILQRMDDDAFDADSTNLTREDWDRWIEWARERAGTTPTTSPNSTSA